MLQFFFKLFLSIWQEYSIKYNRQYWSPQIVGQTPKSANGQWPEQKPSPSHSPLSYPSVFYLLISSDVFQVVAVDRFLTGDPHVCLHFTALRLTVGCCRRIYGSNPEQTTTPNLKGSRGWVDPVPDPLLLRKIWQCRESNPGPLYL